ncbi:hypothetical protein ACFVUH_29790 [Kitasatospora sp. NPDC058032]|uniref:hypothetical protein n=1 Tax=Kitasatospora sp. NPDC058032 TaxID=3346307 RepID=UPI0036DDD81F
MEQPLAPDAGGSESEQAALELRAQLDELLRARQYAGQRERRLAEALRALPDRQRPDAELLRQLTQARTLREGLGARCLELSDRLKALEEQLRQPTPRRWIPRQPTGAPADPSTGMPTNAPTNAPTDPSVGAPPGNPSGPSAEGGRTDARGADGGRADGSGAHDPQQTATAERPTPPAPPRRRSPAELSALAERITALYRRASPDEATGILDQGAEHLTPQDTAHLAALLARRGPAGASVHLARSAVNAGPKHAATTLAELREAGLAEEAGDLFHALRSCPAAGLPALLDALERAGQHADGDTLLWEWGSAPTAELAALATGLYRSDRTADARTLLRQAAGRPTGDLAALAVTMAPPLPALLLGELPALRPPAELVRLAAALAGRPDLYESLLTPLLDDPVRHRTTLAALRTAGLPTTPAGRPRSRWGWRQGAS